MPGNIKRRSVIKAALMGATVAPLAAYVFRANRAIAADTMSILSESSATARSLAYVADATTVDDKAYPNYRPGQSCRNCSEYLGESADSQGACTLILGEFVLAAAWCKAWTQKPGT